MCQENLVVSSGFQWFITTVIIYGQAHNSTTPLLANAKDLINDFVTVKFQDVGRDRPLPKFSCYCNGLNKRLID